jgi:3-oxoacyl-[acyl-carrier protein] reductase
MELNKAKVLVTGGSSGIGLETARQLILKGAKVAICGRDKEKLQKSADEIKAYPIVADVSSEADVIAMVNSVISKFGDYNVLVNNAAYGYFSSLTDIDLEKFNRQLATNLTGAMLVARESAKHFISKNYGNIINISSTAGRKGFAGGTPYVATKFALTGMNECWRDELRKYNIRVMLVNPSEVQTSFVTNSGRNKREYNSTKLDPYQIAQAVCSMLEMDDKGFIPELSVWATNPK